MRTLMILGAVALAPAGCQGARGGYGYGYGYEYEYGYRRPGPYYPDHPAYGPETAPRPPPGWSLHRERYPGAPPGAPERYIWRRNSEILPDP
ncbi:MAG: hypothetical protein RMK90_11840 [Acetobacteraceae bacterium]|nr:hypothetical protein [Acetobacteraceae bacterium]